MRIPSFSKGGEVGFNMTPMIDVVFQLIIFFLVSSHLVKQEQQLKLPLPVAESGIKARPDDKPHLTINVLSDGRIFFGGREVTPSELRSRLAEQRSELGKDIEIYIRGDQTAPYKHFVPVMLSCARAGFWNVFYAVYPSEEVQH